MNFEELVKNPWVIAAAAFLVAEAVMPLIRFALVRLRSYFGTFTGHYIGFTGDFLVGPLLLETAKIRHLQNKIIGTIQGVATIEFDKHGNLSSTSNNQGKYSIKGFVRERLFTISYTSTIPRVRSSGLIVLSGDDSGTVFKGQWAGSVENNVVNANCTWLRLDRSLRTFKKQEELISHALELRLFSFIPLYDKLGTEGFYTKGGIE